MTALSLGDQLRRDRIHSASGSQTGPRAPVVDVAPLTALIAAPDPELSPAAALKEAGRAALDSAAALARQASRPRPLRAYRADWAHYAAWCATMGFRAGAGRTERCRRLFRQPDR
jgi:hypothetical protein